MKQIFLLGFILISSFGYSQNADFTTPNFTICENDCIDFTDASTGTNITSWAWTFDGADTPTSTDQNPSNICFPTAGVYDVTLTITDDIGSDDLTYQITVNNCSSGLTAAFSVDTLLVCAGDCVSFTDLSLGDPTSWSWKFDGAEPQTSNLQNPQNICFDSSGVFDVTLTVSNGIGSDEIISSITVLELPEINGIGDTTIELGGAASLEAVPIDAGSVFWEPSESIDCPTCLDVIATPLITTNYYANIIGNNGCMGRDNVLVIVDFREIVEVPSAFSPNGDGVNDLIKVLGVGITKIDFRIYNRYGQMVFSTTDLDEGWDGTMNGEVLNQGVFVYTLTFDLIDGTSGEKSGNITLVK
ncbi:MAG TPA: gliding motility-associated C-terminal domain-containing protein [Brumimicrobium sp.]|nr:gliding motility-associated C-terminal domain-containing protein [Brumimicrobium sp.]